MLFDEPKNCPGRRGIVGIEDHPVGIEGELPVLNAERSVDIQGFFDAEISDAERSVHGGSKHGLVRQTDDGQAPPLQGLVENQWVAGIFAPAPGTRAIPSYGFFGSPGRKTVRSQRKPLKNEPGTGSRVGVQGEKGRNSAHLERGAPLSGKIQMLEVTTITWRRC